MRIVSKISAGVCLGLVCLGLSAWARPAVGPISGELRALASGAVKKDGWPPLRRYAESAADEEQRGLAYFVLGVREYEAGEYAAAAEDLRQAAETKFLLADFAEYYRAAAADRENQPSQVVEALEGFSARHPQSSLRFEALELLTRVLLLTARPELAIRVLTGEPRVRQRPSLALLLARAYGQAQRLPEAVRAFQEVHCAFPTAPESEAAAEALGQLQTQLGANFPRPTEEMLTARAAILFNNSRFGEALGEYDALLQAQPASPSAARWKIGRARCLLRLKQTREAIETLETPISTDPELDAERLASLVEAATQRGDARVVLQTLEQLRVIYPQSLSYASALFSAGTFFTQRGDWETAARHYSALAEGFPGAEWGLEAHWRAAWAYFLMKKSAKAVHALLDHLKRYPTSPHVPAVLYWLGRLAEERGAVPEARTFYESLQKRFVQSYYAVQADLRVKALPPDPEVGGKLRKSRPRTPIAALTRQIPARAPTPFRPCAPAEPSERLRPFLTLKALSLVGLAEQYLKNALPDHLDASDLLLALSRLKAQQGDSGPALLFAKRSIPRFSEYEFSALPKEVWDLLFPQAFWNLVERHAHANGLDPYLIMGLIRQESAFNPRARSPANARGLMQILPQTASPTRRGRAVVARKLYDPGYNVRWGCRYLRGLLKTFKGSLEQALAAYNAGDPRVKRWLEKGDFREPLEFMETIPIRETRSYVEAVLRDAEIYRQLMTGSAEFAVCRPAAPARRGAGEKKPHVGRSKAAARVVPNK